MSIKHLTGPAFGEKKYPLVVDNISCDSYSLTASNGSMVYINDNKLAPLAPVNNKYLKMVAGVPTWSDISGGAPLPLKTVYVSPGFPSDAFPYFQNLRTACEYIGLQSVNTELWTIQCYGGIYSEPGIIVPTNVAIVGVDKLACNMAGSSLYLKANKSYLETFTISNITIGEIVVDNLDKTAGAEIILLTNCAVVNGISCEADNAYTSIFEMVDSLCQGSSLSKCQISLKRCQFSAVQTISDPKNLYIVDCVYSATPIFQNLLSVGPKPFSINAEFLNGLNIGPHMNTIYISGRMDGNLISDNGSNLDIRLLDYRIESQISPSGAYLFRRPYGFRAASVLMLPNVITFASLGFHNNAVPYTIVATPLNGSFAQAKITATLPNQFTLEALDTSSVTYWIQIIQTENVI